MHACQKKLSGSGSATPHGIINVANKGGTSKVGSEVVRTLRTTRGYHTKESTPASSC
jgi:hypothetical protein